MSDRPTRRLRAQELEPGLQPLGTILVVDDDPDVTEFVADLLTREGHVVVVAHDGNRAMRILLDEAARPDLLLLDVDMPHPSGITILRQLRAMPETHHLPTVVLSGYPQHDLAATCLDRGASDFVRKPIDSTELLARIRLHLRSSRESSRWRIESFVDPVTELLNRRGLHEHLHREVHRAARTRNPLTVVFFDLEGFKAVNDRFGHLTGDRILRYVGDAMRHSLRRVDLAARWGGDEFVMALPDSSGRGARDVADRIRGEVARRTRSSIGETIGMSAGMACLFEDVQPDEPNAPSKLIDAADRSMYRHREGAHRGLSPRHR